MTLNIAVLGHGRMGQEVQNCVDNAENLNLVGVWSRSGGVVDVTSTSLESDDLGDVLSTANIAIDFTLPSATQEVLEAVSAAKIPLVCGVSDLPEDTRQYMSETATRIPILYDRNMSLGIAVLTQMLRLAGTTLGDRFRAEIHETHHIRKRDAPSGTALQLGEALAASRGQEFADAYHYDPENGSDPKEQQIRFEVTRTGDVPGEHTVLLKSTNETLLLQHQVTDRRVFAAGAVTAARWLINQTVGLYSMEDLIR